MVDIAGGVGKREPDALVTKRIKELSTEWTESSNAQLISKVSGSYPQIWPEHLPGTKGELEIPWPPQFKVNQPKPSLNKDLSLFPSDTSRAEVTFGFLQAFKIHRSPWSRTVGYKPHHLPKTWVAGQAPLLRSHSENTETQAVTWHLTKECLHSTLGLCSCNEVSFHFWVALYSGSQRDITSCRNQKWIRAQHCPPPHSFWRRQVVLLHLTTKMSTILRSELNAKFF